MLLSRLIGLLAICALGTLGDTEIRNFRLPLQEPSAPLVSCPIGSPRLEPSTELLLNVSSQQSEQFVLLSLDETYTAWTIRLSWPGSSPTKWSLSLSPTSNVPNEAILHIKASPLSPRMPHPYLPLLTSYLPRPLAQYLLPKSGVSDTDAIQRFPDSGRYPLSYTIGGKMLAKFGWLAGHALNDLETPKEDDTLHAGESEAEKWKEDPWETSFHIILEPLYFGVLPRTAVPAVMLILIFVSGSAFVVPKIIRYLESSHREARESREKKD